MKSNGNHRSAGSATSHLEETRIGLNTDMHGGKASTVVSCRHERELGLPTTEIDNSLQVSAFINEGNPNAADV